MKTKGILSKYTFRVMFTGLSYFIVLKVGDNITNEIFGSIFLYIFPIFYDMMYYSENCTPKVKYFYVISTVYSLFYGFFSLMGLFRIIQIVDGNVVFVKNVIFKDFHIPVEYILRGLGLSIAFVLIDGFICNIEEASQ